MSKNDITRDTLRTRGPSKEYDEGYARIFGTKTPQAECAPREAQPVAYLVDLDDRILEEFERRALGFPLRIDGVPNLNGVRIIEGVRTILDTLSAKQQPVCYVSDMDLALLKRNGGRAADLFVKPGERCNVPLYAAPTPERAQPVGPRTTLNYDGTFDTTCAHCGGNGCFACLKSAAPTPERADAEKDAALPDWRIADGWHNTFSTSNPYCPCDLKSFTKAVRWAERAILATNKK